jgi:hypothetical protein
MDKLLHIYSDYLITQFNASVLISNIIYVVRKIISCHTMVDKAQSEKISASVKALAIFQSRELSRQPKFS